MTTTSALPDGEYNLDLSSLFRSDSLSDIFGIRYSFRPDNIDTAFPKQLIKITTDSNGNDSQDSNSFILKSESKKINSNTNNSNDTDLNALRQIFFEGKRNSAGLVHSGLPQRPGNHNTTVSGGVGAVSNYSRATSVPSIASTSLNLIANQSHSSTLNNSNTQPSSEFILIYDEINKNFKLELFGNNIIKMTKSRTPVESNLKFKKNAKKLKSLSSTELQDINRAQLMDSKPSLYYDNNNNSLIGGNSSLPNSSHNSPVLSPKRFVSSPTNAQLGSSSQFKRNISSSMTNNSSPLLKSINSPIFRPSSTPNSPISSVLKSIPTMKKNSSSSTPTRSKLGRSTLKRSSEDSDVDEIKLTDQVVVKKQTPSSASKVSSLKGSTKITKKNSSISQKGTKSKKKGISPRSPELAGEEEGDKGDDNNDDDDDDDIMDFANELEQELGQKKKQTKDVTKSRAVKKQKKADLSITNENEKHKPEEIEVNLKTEEDEWDVNYSDWDEADFENSEGGARKSIEQDKSLQENSKVASVTRKKVSTAKEPVASLPKGPISMKEMAIGVSRVSTPTLNGGIYSPSSEVSTPRLSASVANVVTPVIRSKKPATSTSSSKKQEVKNETSKSKQENDDSFDGAFDEDFNNAFADYDFDNSDFEDNDANGGSKGPITVDEDEEMSEEE